MPIKKTLLSSAIIFSFALSAQADSGMNSGARSTITLRGFVPVICRVELQINIANISDSGQLDLGTANEFCNSPSGYRVILSHPTDLEGAAIISNGDRIPLSQAGETVITDMPHAAIRTVHLAADLGDHTDRLNRLNIRIEARS